MKKIIICIMICLSVLCFTFTSCEDKYKDTPGTENDGIEP